MRLYALVVLAPLFVTPAMLPGLAFAAAPWPGSRWQADVDEIGAGHHRHTTMLGRETGSERGTQVEVICTDTDPTTGRTRTVRASARAQTRQDDWEGDAGPLGSFGSATGETLHWFGPTPCASGRITWQTR